jgi:hypothetical protein
MPDDERIIVAVPISGEAGLDCEVVTGSARAECVDCGAEVWIAPSSQIIMRLLPDGQCKVLCLECAERAIAEGPQPEFSTSYEEAFRLLTGRGDD